jgi:hypothetical protein
VAALGVGAWGVLTPVAVEEPVVVGGGGLRGRAATSQASPDTQLPLEAFEPIWGLELRRPLSELAGGAVAAPQTGSATHVGGNGPAVSGAGGPFVLVGTIGQSLAMIRTPGGLVEVKGVGDVAGGGRIVAIRPMQVDVEVNGQRQTVSKAREPGTRD